MIRDKYMYETRLTFSLAFRVLLSSISFIVIPLIFYAFYTYNRDYDQKLQDIFDEMHLFQKDQILFMTHFEENNLILLSAIRDLIVQIQSESGRPSIDKIDKILNNFSSKENLSANFYLTVNSDASLICRSSSINAYKNIDFANHINLEHIKQTTFVASDPVFGYSLYLVSSITNLKDEIIGVIGMAIPLSKLVIELDTLRNPYKANISIIDSKGKILASTALSRVGLKFSEITKITKIQSVTNGSEFYLNNERRFLTTSPLPGTQTKIALTIPSKALLENLYKAISELTALLIFILIFGGLISYILTLRFAKPLLQLSVVMEKAGHGDLNQRYQKDPIGFEINYLGEKFNEMVNSLISYIEEVKKERAFKEAYQKELQIGRDIQAAILPEKRIDFFELQTAIYFEPAKEVAGDFYDYMIKGDNLFITIADGVGKGISGCLYAFSLRSTLRAAEAIFDNLSEITLKTNTLFCEDTKESGSFVTAFLAKYHGPTKTLSYVNCGHTYPIIKRSAGNIERLETSGIAFGALLFDTVEVKQTTLYQDDFLIFYSDGLTDAQDTTQKLFSEKRLLHLVETCTYNTPHELLELINKEIALFTKGEPQYDDITILILKI